MARKDDYIRIRVSKEQKELIKKVAAIKGISMSEFVVVITEKFALQELNKVKTYENTKLRVENIDHQLSIARSNMERRRNYKKSFFENLKNRFTNR